MKRWQDTSNYYQEEANKLSAKFPDTETKKQEETHAWGTAEPEVMFANNATAAAQGGPAEPDRIGTPHSPHPKEIEQMQKYGACNYHQSGGHVERIWSEHRS
jgi:hypothetical protein